MKQVPLATVPGFTNNVASGNTNGNTMRIQDAIFSGADLEGREEVGDGRLLGFVAQSHLDHVTGFVETLWWRSSAESCRLQA